jgi:hypothetical protein
MIGSVGCQSEHWLSRRCAPTASTRPPSWEPCSAAEVERGLLLAHRIDDGRGFLFRLPSSRQRDLPKNMTLVFLPSRAPELNPVENVWQYLRYNWLSNRVFDTRGHPRGRLRSLAQAPGSAPHHHLNRPARLGSRRSKMKASGIIEIQPVDLRDSKGLCPRNCPSGLRARVCRASGLLLGCRSRSGTRNLSRRDEGRALRNDNAVLAGREEAPGRQIG